MRDTIPDPTDKNDDGCPGCSASEEQIAEGQRVAEWICRGQDVPAAMVRRALRGRGLDRVDAASVYIEDVRPDVVMPPGVARVHAPTTSGIYFMWAPPHLRMDRPVYIGGSVSLRSRMSGWFGSGDVLRHPWPEPIAIVTMLLYDRQDLAEIERYAIETWAPPRNTAGIEVPYNAEGCWR